MYMDFIFSCPSSNFLTFWNTKADVRRPGDLRVIVSSISISS